MPQKKQVRLAELKLGVFIVAAAIMFLMLILQQSWGLNWFSGSVQLVTYLPNVGGLKSGAPVWLAGIEIGRVRSVTIINPESYDGNMPIYQRIEEASRRIEILMALPELTADNKRELLDLNDDIRDLKPGIRMVEVLLEIRPEYLDRIDGDSEVSIESKGLIGESFIDISPGATGSMLPRKGELYVIESAQSPGFREIMTGANDVMANFGVLSEHLRELAQRLNSDMINSGINNIIGETQDLVQQTNKTFSYANSLLASMQDGKGTVGKLVSDPALYNQLIEAMEKFNALVGGIRSSEGTLGKFIDDPSIYESADATLQKFENIIARIEVGEGTIGRLTTDETLYERTAAALESFATLTEEVDRGEGTIGKLLKDPSLYNNLEQSTAEITRLLSDIRQDPKKFLTIRVRLF